MIEPGRKLRVFLCHSWGDKTSVCKLYQRLKNDGFSPWLDEEDLIPGQDWQREISKEVGLCHVVIVCLSSVSINKEGFVQKEIRIALDAADQKPKGTIFIIPARLEECKVPDRLSQWHWVNLFEESGYGKLVHSLNTRSRELGITPISQAGPAIIPSPIAGTVKVNPQDGQKYVWIPPGTFQMGCFENDHEGFENEKPPHPITITKGFWLGQTPVTQAAYQRVMGNNPSHFHGEQLPIETVTWNQAKAFCEAVGGRLPTEAEWEYAARAGTTGARYGQLEGIAWYRENSGGKTQEVGQKQPNGWNLYDMMGNVWEWVGDWYDEKPYAESPSVDPSGPASGKYRVLRGGSFNDVSRTLRSSVRVRIKPDDWSYILGFRCVREVFP
jgi:formylglycine-generating enzyme required for sulfatase activity